MESPPVKDAVLKDGNDQVYFVPNGTIPFVPLTGVTLNCTPLQTVVLIGVITAFGFTYTTTVKDAPSQLPGAGAVGITE